MCTVVLRVPEDPAAPVRVLAVRDEDPDRPWRPYGAWWPERAEVRGVQDLRAGGAWLASEAGRFAVLLNREGEPDVPESMIASRGGIVLDAVDGLLPAGPLTTRGFNLVHVDADGAHVTSWDGETVRTLTLAPGTHMIAHEDVDDSRTPRIVRWLTTFEDASTDDTGDWWRPWLDALAATTGLDPIDDAAIIRDNRPHGVMTLSLLVCAATISADSVDVVWSALDRPGAWNPVHLHA